MVTTIEAAYFAGLFDGEGSVGIAKHKSRTSRRGHCHELIIQVSSSDKNITVDLKETFGGSVCSFKAPKNLPMWRWTISTKKALAFLEIISPYLRIKKEQAKIATAFQSKKKHQPNISNEYYQEQEKQRNMMMQLNRKGLCSKYKGRWRNPLNQDREEGIH